MQKVTADPLNFSSIDYKIIISEQEIQTRISEIAKQIRDDYGNEELLLVAVLKGSFVFISDLCKQLGYNIIVDFMQVSTYYGGTKSSGNLRIIKDLEVDICGKNVLLVEDIVQSGLTLNHIKDMLQTRSPKSVRTVSLLRKPECQEFHADVEYVGFDIPSDFVVGYGLDYAEYYRNLPFVAQLFLSDHK
jgi:hypoxanthine phosphoribosyltransferase